MESIDFLDGLRMYQWYNINMILDDIREDCISILFGFESERNFGILWDEVHTYLFMKVLPSSKRVILRKLCEIESNLNRIEWVWVKMEGNDFVITLREDAFIDKVMNGNEIPINTGYHILEYFEWIYDHSEMIYIQYQK